MNRIRALLFVLAFAMSSVASVAIITNVDRWGGASGSRQPIGAYTGDTDPLPSDAGGLADGSVVFSDRTYVYVFTPDPLKGAEYIRTFNNDKHNDNSVNYAVILSSACTYAIGIDDRFGGSSQLQAMVDAIAPDFIPAGTFADSGLDLTIHEQNAGAYRPISVFTATLPAGSYTFTGRGFGGRRNFMIMGAIPEPTTIALLGFGGLALLRRKRS